MDHEAKESQHGGTSVVELDATLEVLLLLVECVPAEVETTVTEITDEFTWLGAVGRIQHHETFEETNEGKHLEKTGFRNGLDGGPTVGDGLEGGSGKIDVSWKANSIPGHDLTKEAKHADTPVLDLDVTKTVETVLVGIFEEAKGIEQAEWWLDSKLTFEGHGDGRRRNLLGCRGEGSGRAGEKGGDDELHCYLFEC